MQSEVSRQRAALAAAALNGDRGALLAYADLLEETREGRATARFRDLLAFLRKPSTVVVPYGPPFDAGYLRVRAQGPLGRREFLEQVPVGALEDVAAYKRQTMFRFSPHLVWPDALNWLKAARREEYVVVWLSVHWRRHGGGHDHGVVGKLLHVRPDEFVVAQHGVLRPAVVEAAYGNASFPPSLRPCGHARRTVTYLEVHDAEYLSAALRRVGLAETAEQAAARIRPAWALSPTTTRSPRRTNR